MLTICQADRGEQDRLECPPHGVYNSVQGSIQGIINKPVKDIISDADICCLGKQNKTSEGIGRAWEDSLRQGGQRGPEM